MVNINLNIDNQKVLDRIVAAYGFSTKAMLAQHFDMAASSLSNRYKRDNLPFDMIVQCVLETNTSLKWLVTGEGAMHENMIAADTSLTVDKLALVSGRLVHSGTMTIDLEFMRTPLKKPQALISDGDIFLIDNEPTELTDGKWLVEIEGQVSIRDLALIPVKKVHVTGGKVPFECDISDIRRIGQVVGIYSEIK
ncbi:phage repressor protein CI [Yersinia aldovae]|uniref:phage repressor protein CI n=1 Tax=Yersinia aldovae TaxID=29483 RepID=UPI0011A7184A|nr:phage repressor protein CI [Yersinia aldovae]